MAHVFLMSLRVGFLYSGLLRRVNAPSVYLSMAVRLPDNYFTSEKGIQLVFVNGTEQTICLKFLLNQTLPPLQGASHDSETAAPGEASSIRFVQTGGQEVILNGKGSSYHLDSTHVLTSLRSHYRRIL